jgi:hypothetical protein
MNRSVSRSRAVMSQFLMVAALLAAMATPLRSATDDDQVLRWNDVALRAIRTSVPAVPGALQQRLVAIVHVAMFDAVNGIERRYSPIHVAPDAPRGASVPAAAAQAAYTALTGLFPSQSFDQDLEASLDAISAQPSQDNSVSIDRGRVWGEQVALEILAWRAADGLTPPAPPFIGGNAAGEWRPTPPGFLPGLVPTMATTLPFVIEQPSSFRSTVGPPSLTSQAYADGVNEIQSVGSLNSVTRTADQTLAARFWAATANSFWNRAAADASRAHHLTLSENARLFALLNIAEADAIISCWDSKYFFVFWRPITAIQLADTDGNPATVADPTWTPLLVTPNYPEYDSGHQSVSRSSATVLIAYFGDSTPLQGFSEGVPGVVRQWANFTAAADEAFMARIWAGFHYRFTMEETRSRAIEVATYVLQHAALPINGARTGQVPDSQ